MPNFGDVISVKTYVMSKVLFLRHWRKKHFMPIVRHKTTFKTYLKPKALINETDDVYAKNVSNQNKCKVKSTILEISVKTKMLFQKYLS